MFDYEGSRGEFLRILAEIGEEPAFINRGIAPQRALDALLERCAIHRDEQLEWPRRHFSALRRRIAADWSRLQRILTHENEIDLFVTLEQQLKLDERTNTLSFFTNDRRAVQQFIESGIRFNNSWSAFVSGDGLEHVNEMRENYNRFYPMEKACAFGNDGVNEGFQPLPQLDASFLLERFPLLVLPKLR